jgi:hypothetical protein
MDGILHMDQALLQFVCLHHVMPPMRFPRNRGNYLITA